MSGRNIVKFLRNSRTLLLRSRQTRHLIVARDLHAESTSVLLTRIHYFQLPTKTNNANFSTKPLTAATLKPSLIDSDALVEKLKQELTATGFVNADNLSKAIQALSFNLLETESNFLLDCCASLVPSEKPQMKVELFYRIWNAINKNSKPTKENYLKAAKILRNQRRSLEDFEKLLTGCSFKDDIEIYEALIYLAAENRNIQKMNDLVDEIRNKNLKLTENIFNAMILGYSNDGKLNECKIVLEKMNAANLLPNSDTYTELINAHIINNDQEGAEKLLSQHGNALKTEQLVRIIRSAALNKLQSIIEICLKYESSGSTNIKEVPLIIRRICIELIYQGHPDKAFLIVNSFPKPQFNENQDTDTFGTFLIWEFIKSNQNSSSTIQMCHELISTEKNTRALHLACEFAIRQNSPCAMEYLQTLSEIEPLRPHYFWPIILQRFRSDGEAGIMDTIKSMVEMNVECDYETISFYVLPRLSITLTNIKKAIKILEKNGLKTSQFMTPLVSHLIFQQKFDDIITLLESYKTKINTENLCYPLIHIIGNIKATKTNLKLIKLLQILISKAQNPNYDFIGQFLIELLSHPKYRNDFDAIKNLIRECHENDLKISHTAADHIMSALQMQKNHELKTIIHKMINGELKLPSSLEFYGSNIAHPRDMNLEELECHLIELESKNLNTRGVLRRLLQMLVREGKLERALEVKEKCDRLKVQVSPGMMASIFDMYIKLKKCEEAERYFAEIKKTFPGFLVDEHKIIDYASLIIENNRLEDAKRILEERVRTSKVTGGEYIQKNIWQLLNNIANLPLSSSSSSSESTDPKENQTKEMFLTLCKYGFCTPHNTLLGPIIREYINRRQIRIAVDEFKAIAKIHKKTPLQLELISLLVALSNGIKCDDYNLTTSESKQLLQEVVSYATSIHGNMSVNGNLLIAIAETGTETQLRKLLIDPNFRFNQDALMRNCEHLSNHGKIEALMKLAKASRGLRHMKEDDLYEMLLNHFIRDNNCESALALYEKLSNDDELKISQEFIKNLTNLLKMNNFKIPSSLAIQAQIM